VSSNLTGRPVSDRRTVDGAASGRKILDSEHDYVAAAQLAVDGHIEQREVSRPTLDLQSHSYRPNELPTKWRFRTDQLAFVPGRSPGLT
jgi:hypothetical protein